MQIKTDILRVQIMRYSNNFVFMSEKRDVLGRQPFLNRFVSGPYNRLKNLTAAVNATNSATRILIVKREGNRTKSKSDVTNELNN